LVISSGFESREESKSPPVEALCGSLLVAFVALVGASRGGEADEMALIISER
jgi:hypothetical protein